MSAVARVREIVGPIVEGAKASLYDIEHESGILRIMVDRPGGIDIDTVGELSQLISAALDAHDPLPGQRYLLEVTSPGIERKLRLPEHYQQQVGADVNIKVKKAIDGARRFEGRLESASDESIEIVVDGPDGATRKTLNYDSIEAARTVFHWEGQAERHTDRNISNVQDKPTNKKASSR